MAVTLSIKYLWPPNFTEGTDTMDKNQRRIAVRFTGVASDGTEQSAVQLIDKSDLLGPVGAEPSHLVIEEVEWSISTFDSVIILWDEASDEEALRLSGAGFKDYRSVGGLHQLTPSGTGDLVVSTLGAAANASYDISMVLRLKE